ncbi:MAG: hypothetical protein JO067_10000 [Cupriavidus sp.]|nr:hypothetical protein [Cupriavidus sp.]
MLKYKELEPRFVTTIPRPLEGGVLYVSMEYGTVVHSCCCGCGQEVVTPLTPTDWSLTFNGETVSLWPSVGSWNLPCQSHYVIKGNKVLQAGAWSPKMVKKEVARDKAAKAQYYGGAEKQPVATDEIWFASKTLPEATRHRPWERFRRWLLGQKT